MKYITFIFIFLVGCSLPSQEIHPLEKVSSHYKTLQKLDGTAQLDFVDLDKISFPTDGLNPGKQFIGIEPSYLMDEQIVQLQSFVHFPANSSKQTKAELDYLLELEKERTSELESRVMELARIGYWPPLDKNSPDLGRNVEHLFFEYNEITNQNVKSSDYLKTRNLLAGVTRDMRIIEFTVKYHLLRARPYHLEPRLNAMAEMSSPSFASGHTLWAYIHAFTWSELLPELRKDFLNIAFEIGHSREIMGIHYPSDEEAARILAHQMLVFMNENPTFKKDLKAAKEEWR